VLSTPLDLRDDERFIHKDEWEWFVVAACNRTLIRWVIAFHLRHLNHRCFEYRFNKFKVFIHREWCYFSLEMFRLNLHKRCFAMLGVLECLNIQ
jgi:hypothetical protein